MIWRRRPKKIYVIPSASAPWHAGTTLEVDDGLDCLILDRLNTLRKDIDLVSVCEGHSEEDGAHFTLTMPEDLAHRMVGVLLDVGLPITPETYMLRLGRYELRERALYISVSPIGQGITPRWAWWHNTVRKVEETVWMLT